MLGAEEKFGRPARLNELDKRWKDQGTVVLNAEHGSDPRLRTRTILWAQTLPETPWILDKCSHSWRWQ